MASHATPGLSDVSQYRSTRQLDKGSVKKNKEF